MAKVKDKQNPLETEADLIGQFYANLFSSDFLNKQQSRNAVIGICMKASQKTASKEFTQTIMSMLDLKCHMDDAEGNPSTAARLSAIMQELRKGQEPL